MKKNPPKVRLVFDRKKTASKVGVGHVEIEVYYAGRQYRVCTGVAVRPVQYDKDRVVRHPEAVSLNARLAEQLSRAYRYANECHSRGLAELSNNTLNSLMSDKQDVGVHDDLFAWLEDRISSRAVRPGTRRQHRVMMRSLRESGLFRSFNDLTVSNIKRWNDILQSRLGCQSTVHSYNKRFKPYVAEAVLFGLLKENPYDKIKISRGHAASDRKYLTESERDAIEALDLTGGEERARDVFIFCCYTGLAFSDAAKVTENDVYEDNGKLYIDDRRMKSGTRYKIQLLPKAEAILRKYGFRLDIISNQQCNVFLKIIAVKVGLRIKLTSHVGRHTFATWALSKGIKIEVVSKMLAHSDITTTQIYAKILQQDVEEGYDKLAGLSAPDKSGPKGKKPGRDRKKGKGTD